MVGSLKQRLGVLVYEWQTYRQLLAAGGTGWLQLHNRDEEILVDPDGPGVHCEWRWTSLLHAPRMFPSLGRKLFQRAARWQPYNLDVTDFQPAPKPDITFIIGHRGTERLPHLLMTLKSIAGQVGVSLECIVVEQSDERLIQSSLPQGVQYRHCASKPASAKYNRSLAFNRGAEIANAEFLVCHDNDLLIPTTYARDLVAKWRAGAEVINIKRFIFYLDQTDTDTIFRTGQIPENCTPLEIMQNATGGGSIAVDRRAYWEIGGHDEGFVGWGGEDVDFWDRAITRRLDPFAHASLIHLWHPAQPDKTPQKDSDAMQRSRKLSKVPVDQRIDQLVSKRN